MRESHASAATASGQCPDDIGGPLANDEEGRSGMLQQEARDAAEGELCTPAAAVSGEDHQVDVILGDATQDLAADVAVDGHEGAYPNAVSADVLLHARQVDLGSARVAVD
jgi:hypothetical protein